MAYKIGNCYEGKKLVEDFGGYWKEYDLWSEEFIHGETTGKFLRQISKHKNEGYQETARNLWPYLHLEWTCPHILISGNEQIKH